MLELKARYNTWHKDKNSSRISRTEKITNEKILNILGVKEEQALLDLGCGKSSFCNSAFNKGIDVFGIDFSETALKETKSVKKGINYVLSDTQDIPFKDRFFDYVVCLGSFEH